MLDRRHGDTHSPIWRSTGCIQEESQVFRHSGALQLETWCWPQAEMGHPRPTYTLNAWSCVRTSAWQAPGSVLAAAAARVCVSQICIAEGSVQHFGHQLVSLCWRKWWEIMGRVRAWNPASVGGKVASRASVFCLGLCVYTKVGLSSIPLGQVSI